MDKLSTYISAIHELTSPVAIVRRESEADRWLDQDFEVTKTITTYWFDNGVVIRKSVERDTFPSELACSECWINFEVIAQSELLESISPRCKTFENSCRESFWLAYYRA